METIKSIKCFQNPHELIEWQEGSLDDLGLTDDELCCLEHLNDYEGMNFFLINDDTVMVTDFLGDMSGEPESYDDFLKNTIEWVKENA